MAGRFKKVIEDSSKIEAGKIPSFRDFLRNRKAHSVKVDRARRHNSLIKEEQYVSDLVFLVYKIEEDLEKRKDITIGLDEGLHSIINQVKKELTLNLTFKGPEEKLDEEGNKIFVYKVLRND